MKPIRPRIQVWPFAALPSAAAVALVAASIGFADDQTTPSSPKTAQAASPTPAQQASATPPAPAEDYRQISFEVRFIDFVEHPWRKGLEGRLTPCGPDSEARGWIIDKEGLNDLLKHLPTAPTTNILQAPKVVTFEDSQAMIRFGGGPGGVGASNVEVKGSFSPVGTRISVDLIGPTRSAKLPARTGGPKSESPPSQPDAGEFHYKVSSDVPTGSSLVVSMWRYENRVGPPKGMTERLIVITPRRIEADRTDKTLRVPAGFPTRND